MGRGFGSRIAKSIEEILQPDGQEEYQPANERVSGAGRNPSEGDPAHGIPAYPHPLPGGHEYPVNKPVVPEHLDVPPPQAYYTGGMAHGVKSPVKHNGRPAPEHHERRALETEPAHHEPRGREPLEPIPVRITENISGFTSASMKTVAVPAAGSMPVQLCGRNPNRLRVLLLNESSSSNVRFATLPGELTGGNGALLPWPTNTYRELKTQDEVWAVSADSGVPYVSVIQEYSTGRA